MEHSNKYPTVLDRLTNGVPYTVEAATARITALADALEITQEEADELLALAKQHGTEGMTIEERVAALEARSMEQDEALMELAGMLATETGEN